MSPARRFVAQRLRLAARTVPHSQKLAFVGQEHVCSAAIKDATAQEAALYKRAANKQVRWSKGTCEYDHNCRKPNRDVMCVL